MKKETKVYFYLVLLVAILAAFSIFLPQGDFLPIGELPASKPIIALANFLIVLVVYGVLGFLGLRLSKKVGFVSILDKNISNKQRFLTPAYIGIGIGVLFIIVDIIFAKFNGVGNVPHPPFFTAIIASLSAGIGEEIIFRLFFISFWFWLVFYIILKKKFLKQGFWIIAFVSAIVFALGHVPSVLLILGLDSIKDISNALMAEIILLNGILSLFAAYYFRKYGILAAMGIHFWTDIIWHVIWGIF